MHDKLEELLLNSIVDVNNAYLDLEMDCRPCVEKKLEIALQKYRDCKKQFENFTLGFQ